MKTQVELTDIADTTKKVTIENTATRGKVQVTIGDASVVVDASELAAAARKAAR